MALGGQMGFRWLLVALIVVVGLASLVAAHQVADNGDFWVSFYLELGMALVLGAFLILAEPHLVASIEKRARAAVVEKGVLPSSQAKLLQSQLDSFADRLQTIADNKSDPPTSTVRVSDHATDRFDSYPEDGNIVIGSGMAADPHVVKHQYAHIFLRVLNEQLASARNDDNDVAVIEAALAYYLACSSDHIPLVHITEFPRSVQPRPAWKMSRLDVISERTDEEDSDDAHVRSLPLARSLWAARSLSDPDRCDCAAVVAWHGMNSIPSISSYGTAFVRQFASPGRVPSWRSDRIEPEVVVQQFADRGIVVVP